jgi:cation diffusion facilitator family transporter
VVRIARVLTSNVDDCCNHKGDEIAALGRGARRRVLLIVLAINLVMFVAELGAGIVARSTALMADSVDMLGDAFVYVLSLYALARGPRWKAGAALTKGVVILLFGAAILTEVVDKLATGVTPTSSLMAMFGALALIANLSCLALLWRHRDEDVNMSSTFECSRNDVVANVGVLVAAAGVSLTDEAWPDILAGTIVALLFLRSAVGVIRRAWPALHASSTPVP